jgi:hypothetical protein
VLVHQREEALFARRPDLNEFAGAVAVQGLSRSVLIFPSGGSLVDSRRRALQPPLAQLRTLWMAPSEPNALWIAEDRAFAPSVGEKFITAYEICDQKPVERTRTLAGTTRATR